MDGTHHLRVLIADQRQGRLEIVAQSGYRVRLRVIERVVILRTRLRI